MTSRIDVIGSNGNDGLHYQDDDLTWLAMNVHEWESNCHYLVKTLDNGFNWIVGEMECRDNAVNYYTKQQWLDCRAELQNKPRFEDHPDAKCFVQNSSGEWYKNTKASDVVPLDVGYWRAKHSNRNGWVLVGQGEVLGDWHNTLEKRPEHIVDANENANETASDTHITPETMFHGMKHDNEKPRMDLIPPTAERLLAEVLSYGAEKYAPDNWRKVPDAKTRYIAAAMRHINAHRSGELIDSESGLPHLAHAMCSLAFILELDYE